jgi:hypothetical protein
MGGRGLRVLALSPVARQCTTPCHGLCPQRVPDLPTVLACTAIISPRRRSTRTPAPPRAKPGIRFPYFFRASGFGAGWPSPVAVGFIERGWSLSIAPAGVVHRGGRQRLFAVRRSSRRPGPTPTSTSRRSTCKLDRSSAISMAQRALIIRTRTGCFRVEVPAWRQASRIWRARSMHKRRRGTRLPVGWLLREAGSPRSAGGPTNCGRPVSNSLGRGAACTVPRQTSSDRSPTGREGGAARERGCSPLK